MARNPPKWQRWPRLSAGQAGWLGLVIVLLLPASASAHERFIKHDLLHPTQRVFFHRLDPNMVQIALRVTAVMALLLFIWFLRDQLTALIENRLLGRVREKPQQWARQLLAFLTDRPVEAAWFTKLSTWTVPLLLRAPALVLMYAATSRALVMPSYPLRPAISALFKYVQVLMAMGIITQTWLPFTGAAVLGTVLYLLYAFDWKIAVDVLPLLATAAVYVSVPWESHRTAITELSDKQMRWVRLLLGFAFLALGWMKLYNHDLTIGVADNYPQVLNDPAIKLFYVGTDPRYTRECWSTAFGLTEVLTGFLTMAGVFHRFWSAVTLYVFTKLMLVDFGFAEIPHLYPISVLLAITLSNHLSHESAPIDDMVTAHRGKTGKTILIAALASVVIAVVAIFPMLYLLTKVKHP